jgi:hypothetical protein
MKVIELALFKLKSNVTESHFLVALRGTNQWLASQPGFVRRYHGTSDEGRMDLVEWENMAAAKAAADQFVTAPEIQIFLECIEPETVIMRHFEFVS